MAIKMIKKSITHVLILSVLIPYTAVGLGKDTVEVDFGKSKIQFLVKDKADLELLKTYDLNKLVEDMPNYLDEAEDNRGQLRMIQKVENSSEDDEKSKKKWKGYWCGRRSRHVHNIHVDLGLDNWLEGGRTPDNQGLPYGLKPIESRYIGIGSIHKIRIGKRRGPINFQFGGEIHWTNYMFQNQITLRQDDVGNPSFVEVKDVTGGYASSKSKLTVCDFGIPLTFGYSDRRDRFNFNLGGYMNYRLASYTRIVYHAEGNKNDLRDYKNYGINNLRYGVTGNIGYHGFSGFIRYDLVPLFSDASGLPELNTVVIGIKAIL